MPFTWLRPVLLSLGVLLVSATISPAKLADDEVPPRGLRWPGGRVASPEIADPRFHHVVILIVRHDDGGVFGIAINRPLAERPLAELVRAIGLDSTGITGTVRIFAGGPVEPGVGFIVHDADTRRAGTMDIDGRVAMTSSSAVLLDIGRKRGPAKSLVAFGYSGWGAGQLEGEMARGDWFITPEDPALVFDEDREKVWDDAMAHRAGAP